MVTRRIESARPEPANLTADQMRGSFVKLERRIKDLEDFDPNSIQARNDPRIKALETKLQDTIADIFGAHTIEANRFAPRSLDLAGYNMLHPTPMGEVIRSLATSREREITNLRTIIELFSEKLADSGETASTRARRAFGDLNLHPEITRACTKLFEDGHYADSVETACKVLDLMVKMRAMNTDPSGTELMQLVFSPKAPILKFSDQTCDSERSEQQGMMYLFAGAMLALRNLGHMGLWRTILKMQLSIFHS